VSPGSSSSPGGRRRRSVPPVPELRRLFAAAGSAPRIERLDLDRLEGELSRVRSREQARLLALAAELALAATLEGRLLTGALAPPTALPEWSRRCAAELDRSLVDDAHVDGELIACGLLPVRAWPPAAVLAASACRLEDTPEHRLVLARARFAEGRRESAREGYARLERARLPLPRRAQLREARGIAAEGAGEPRLALREFERSAALGAGARVSLAALVVALELGLEERTAWALEAIESAEPDFARLPALLREVVERRALLRRPVSAAVVSLADEALQLELRDLLRERRR
jgi:hypothetical protein